MLQVLGRRGLSKFAGLEGVVLGLGPFQDGVVFGLDLGVTRLEALNGLGCSSVSYRLPDVNLVAVSRLQLDERARLLHVVSLSLDLQFLLD